MDQTWEHHSHASLPKLFEESAVYKLLRCATHIYIRTRILYSRSRLACDDRRCASECHSGDGEPRPSNHSTAGFVMMFERQLVFFHSRMRRKRSRRSRKVYNSFPGIRWSRASGQPLIAASFAFSSAFKRCGFFLAFELR